MTSRCTDANHIWASGSYGRVMRTTDGGQNWSVSIVSDPVMVMQGIKFVNNQVGWIAGEWASMGILFRSTDGGVTWQQAERALRPAHSSRGSPRSADRNGGRWRHLLRHHAPLH